MILNSKLKVIGDKIDAGEKLKIMIIGLGSVGAYLLDYLIGLQNSKIEIIVVGRNGSKMLPDVNIIKTAATIRGSLVSKITIDDGCDLENADTIAMTLAKHCPDIVVNSSRVYSGLKYGSISWHNLRAYGIWTPLAVRYARNIMLGYQKSQSQAIIINTSYSDAVIPWLKSAGVAYPDFGSGNLNHLVPRIKFAIAAQFGIDNLNEIDVTLATSHFHDVVISKEGQTDGVDVLLAVKYNGKTLNIDKKAIFEQCSIAMPVDQKRNMMNASSNFNIISAILTALNNKTKQKVHSPGVDGQIGGYPFIIDGAKREAYFDTRCFSMAEMVMTNRQSIALDGIENIENGCLIYTDDLVAKVKKAFNVELPKCITFDQIDQTADFLIENIIKANIKS